MRTRFFYSCLALAMMCLVAGCTQGTGTSSTSVAASLSASPASVAAGAQVNLTWSTTNATSVSIDNGIGSVPTSGTRAVSPVQTTTYTLTATGSGQTVVRAATVTVTSAPAPTITFSASPTSIQTLSGQKSTLTWSTTNASTVSIDNGIGTVATSGTQVVSPTQTTTYTLTAVGNGQTATGTTVVTMTPLTGVLEWKGSQTGNGLYQETTLTPANVNATNFGKVRTLMPDGDLLAQPLYVHNVDLGAQGVHDLIIAATEHDSIYAFDGKGPSTAPLWHRSFLSPAGCTTNCITVQPDDHGGRSTFGGEVGITGTPVIDPKTGILYVVAATMQNGVIQDTLHSIDIRTGQDAGVGSVVIQASVPGTGEDSVNGKIDFNAEYENQRAGLALSNGVLYIPFGSFSDVPPFHGWLLAYDPTTLKAVFNSTPTYKANDPAYYEEGVGAGFWNSGASLSFEKDGTFFIVAANGSTDVQIGGVDYGDTVLHLSLENGDFKVLDWFTPFNRDCIDRADLEIGSGGVTFLPPEVSGGKSLGVTITKAGRLYLLDRSNLGHFNAIADQVPQTFMVGAGTCNASTGPHEADGTTWNRLYGNVSYWNGNLYMAAANAPTHQYSIINGVINPTPVAVAPTATYVRGGNTVVSANGNSNGIVWMYEKTSDGNAVLHAYDATDISRELWNSKVNASRDALNTGGEAFQAPVVIDGKVLATSGRYVDVYTLLP